MRIRLGTRASKLALAQTQIVVNKLHLYDSRINCEIKKITTTGDVVQDRPLHDIGGKALFVKEIEQALIENTIDIAIHSLKDIPWVIPEELVIGAVLERQIANDVLISKYAKTLEELDGNAIIGTSSVRRKLFLQLIRNDFKIRDVRGNIDSRVNKILTGEVDALILAAAGLKRLNLDIENYINLIPIKQMIPAAGQGVIALEIRKDDDQIKNIVKAINHTPSWITTKVERAFIEYLQADCNVPLAAYATLNGDVISTSFMLGKENGKAVFMDDVATINSAADRAIIIAKKMRNMLGY